MTENSILPLEDQDPKTKKPVTKKTKISKTISASAVLAIS